MVNYSDTIDRTLLLGRSYRFEKDHALRVSRLALRLFDQLQPLHDMGNTEWIWLRTGALLADAGKRINPKDHRKVARDIIVDASDLPFRRPQRILIGLVARYHRGALPNRRHASFRDLEPEARRYVARLAALLRLADGLDKGRAGLVEEVRCTVERGTVWLTLFGQGAPTADKVRRKADLLEKVFARSVVINSKPTCERLGFSLASTDETPYSQTV